MTEPGGPDNHILQEATNHSISAMTFRQQTPLDAVEGSLVVPRTHLLRVNLEQSLGTE